MTNEQDLYILKNLKKTHGASRIPKHVFRECRLPKKPEHEQWRQVCGTEKICRTECPRCWSLWIEEMRIPRGKKVGILGHSGSAKTTLLNQLSLLDRPDEDSDTFQLNYLETQQLQTLSLVSGKHQIQSKLKQQLFGFVFQLGYLTANLTAFQNVALPLALAGTKRKLIQQRVEELTAQMDFPKTRLNALPRHLSGGEYQRIAVARALSHNPQIVFADEPTGSLDPVTGQRVMELLTQWCDQDDTRTLMLVTHNLEHALEYCDYVFVLVGGKISFHDSTENIDASRLHHALKKPISITTR